MTLDMCCFCCDNLWKSIAYGSGKSLENLGIFFSYFVFTVGGPNDSKQIIRLLSVNWSEKT